MTAKGEVVAVWGFTLIIIRGFVSGDFQELVGLMTGQTTSVSNPGLILRLVGMTVLIIILILGADADNTWADLSMTFLAALTLLFFVTYSSQLQGWVNTLLSGFGGGSSQTPQTYRPGGTNGHH